MHAKMLKISIYFWGIIVVTYTIKSMVDTTYTVPDLDLESNKVELLVSTSSSNA